MRSDDDSDHSSSMSDCDDVSTRLSNLEMRERSLCQDMERHREKCTYTPTHHLRVDIGECVCYVVMGAVAILLFIGIFSLLYSIFAHPIDGGNSKFDNMVISVYCDQMLNETVIDV